MCDTSGNQRAKHEITSRIRFCRLNFPITEMFEIDIKISFSALLSSKGRKSARDSGCISHNKIKRVIYILINCFALQVSRSQHLFRPPPENVVRKANRKSVTNNTVSRFFNQTRQDNVVEEEKRFGKRLNMQQLIFHSKFSFLILAFLSIGVLSSLAFAFPRPSTHLSTNTHTRAFIESVSSSLLTHKLLHPKKGKRNEKPR
jgi:hypothetical protein